MPGPRRGRIPLGYDNQEADGLQNHRQDTGKHGNMSEGGDMTDINLVFDLRRDQNETPNLIPIPTEFRLKFERELMDLKTEYRSSGDETLGKRIEALDSAFRELQERRAEIVWDLGYSITPDPNLTIDEESAFEHLTRAHHILRSEA